MKHKIRVNTFKGTKTLLLNKEEWEDLKAELGGNLKYIREFISNKGEIITSDEILGFSGKE